ncbi:MAG: protein kinase [Planctomycetota bacterium]|jgi:serine/threonine protein kinase|nr:protein kinase [Planctomycetota bacterium]
MGSRIDDHFARLAQKKGFVTSGQVSEARRIQATGVELRLATVLLRQGWISRDQAQEVVRDLRKSGSGEEKTLLVCPDCESPFHLKGFVVGQEYICNRCGSVLKEEGEGTGSRTFGDYQILGEIDRGGMGIVYRARQKVPDRIVALKILRMGKGADDQKVGRFLAEVESAGSLQHPGIVSIHESGEIDGQHYFTMEYVEGRDLQQVVDEGVPSLEYAIYLIREIAQALDYAHASGIVHRDLKPKNILVDLSGTPKITDFGLAKVLHGEMNLTRSDQAIGTPNYMSPEQARGDSKYLDGRSDVFSLGVIFYGLLTGHLPFEAPTAIQLFHKICNEEPIAPRKWVRSIPRDVETICLKCLEKSIESRYRSAGDIVEDLERFQEGESILANRTSLWSRARQKLRKHRRIAVIVCGVVLVAGILSVSLYFRHQEDLRRKDRLKFSVRQQRSHFDRYLERGADLARSGQYEESVNVFSSALKVPVQVSDEKETRRVYAPNEKASILLARGRSYMAFGRFRRAEEDFQQALKSIEGPVPVWMEMARLMRRTGRLDQASVYLQKIEALNQDLPAAAAEYSYLFTEQERFEDALQSMDLYLKARPDDRKMIHKRGLLSVEVLLERAYGPGKISIPLVVNDHSDRAVLDRSMEARLSRALEDLDSLLDPLNPDPLLCVARSQLALFSGDRVRPYDLLDQAVQGAPEGLDALVARGVFRLSEHHYLEADKDLRKAWDLSARLKVDGVRIQKIRFLAGATALYVGDLVRAQDLLKDLGGDSIYRAGSEQLLGLISKVQGKDEVANAHWQQSLLSDESLWEVRSFLADGYQRLDLFAKARRVLAPRESMTRVEKLQCRVTEIDGEIRAAHRVAGAKIRDDIEFVQGVLTSQKGVIRARTLCVLGRLLGIDGDDNGSRKAFEESAEIRSQLPMVRNLLRLASRYRQEGDLQRACNLYGLLIAYFPDFSLLYLQRGLLQMEIPDVEKGLADLEQVLKENPFHVELHLVRGRDIYLRSFQEPEQAIEDLEIYLRKRPEDPEGWIVQAEILLELNAPNRCFDSLENALEYVRAKKGRVSSFEERARAILSGLSRGEGGDLEEVLQREIEKNLQELNTKKSLEKSIQDRCRQARALFGKRDYFRSLQILDSVVQNHPHYVDISKVYYQRAQTHLRLGMKHLIEMDFEHIGFGLLDFSRALENNFHLSEKFFRNLDYLQFLHRGDAMNHNQIVKTVEEVVQQFPEESAAQFLQGILALGYAQVVEALGREGKTDLPDPSPYRRYALESMNRTLELNPEHAVAMVLRGYLHQILGDMDRAIQDYNVVLRKFPDLLVTHFYIASYYGKRGETELAIRHLERVFEIRRTMPDFDKEGYKGVLGRIDHMADFEPIRNSDSFHRFLEPFQKPSGVRPKTGG